MFPEALLDAAVAELTAIDRGQMTSAATRRMVKRETSDHTLLGPSVTALLDDLHGGPFLSFIERVTAIRDLSSDSNDYWAAVHETPPGGFTMVHSDFSVHPDSGFRHRTNALLYLNRDWQPAWGGQLELWPKDMGHLGRSIEPEFNTLVLFETTPETLHGLPTPVATDDGRSRWSLAAYQYTRDAPAKVAGRRTRYVARPGDSLWLRLPTWWDVKERLPAPLRRAAAGIRHRLRRP